METVAGNVPEQSESNPQDTSVIIEKSVLESLVNQRFSIHKIGQELGVPRTVVLKSLTTYDLKPLWGRLDKPTLLSALQESATRSELSRRLDCSMAVIKREMSRHGIPQSELPKGRRGGSKIELPREQLQEMVNNNIRPEDMAETFGCSAGVVRRELLRQGLVEKPKTPSKEDLEALVESCSTLTEASEALGVSAYKVKKYLTQHGIDGSKFNSKRGRKKSVVIPKEELQKMLTSGIAAKQIAEHFGCSVSTVYNQKKSYEIV